MSDLKPCPFCGKAPHDDNDPVARRVTCRTKGCAMDGLSISVPEWNTRAHGATTVAQVKDLKAALTALLKGQVFDNGGHLVKRVIPSHSSIIHAKIVLEAKEEFK